MAGMTMQTRARGSRAGSFLLAGAVLLGLVTAALVVTYVRQETRVQRERVGAQVQVVVAKRDIPLAANITSDMVEAKIVPADAAVAAAFSEVARVIGLRARYPIAAGTQIVPGMVVQASAADALSYVIPPGKRAVAVKTSEVVSGGGHIRPGDFVDVLVTIEVTKLVGGTPTPGAEKLKGTYTILQNIEVLAVDDQAEKVAEIGPNSKEKDNAGRFGVMSDRNRTVTLAVDPQQAQLLFLAEAEGTIRLALRPFGERDEQPLTPVLEPLVPPGSRPAGR